MAEDNGKPERRLAILYVDDEESMRVVFKQFAETVYATDVETAESVDDALHLLSKKEPDAIVSDFQMPGKTGIDFLKALRSSGSAIPFILFTGRGREEVVIEALNSGADFYMQKGGDPNALFAELMHFVRLAVARREKDDELRELSTRLESFIQNTSDAILLFDVDGSIFSVNPAFEKLYGWSAEEAVGRQLPMVPPEFEDEVKRRFKEVADSGKPQNYEGKRLRKDGSNFEASMTISAVKGPDGKTIGIAGLARDITYERRLIEALSRQREELNVLIESITDAVISTDVEGRVAYMNSVASTLTGYTPEEAQGKNIGEVFHIASEDSGEAVEVPVDAVIRNGLLRGMANHTVLTSRDGSVKLIEDSAAPLTDSLGKVRGVVMVFRDATKKKLTERRREARRLVSEILASSESLDGAMPNVLETLVKTLKMDLAELWTLREEDDKLHLKSSWHYGSKDARRFTELATEFSFSKGIGLPGAVWQNVKPRWIPDIQRDKSYVRRGAAAETGLKSAFGVPLTSKGDPIGVMLLYSKNEMPPDEEMMNTIGDIGKQIGLFASRIGAEAELRLLLENSQSLVQNTPLAIITTDLNGNFVSVNSSFERTYGWRTDEVIGKNIRTIVPEDEQALLEEMLDKVRNGFPTSFEGKRLTKDGGIVDIRAMLSPIKDRNGRTTHLISICREVTGEKKMEEEIQRNHTVIENLEEMVLIAKVDEKGEPMVVYANPSFLKKTGKSTAEINGRKLWELDSASIDSETMKEMLNAFTSGGPYRGEVLLKGEDGTVQHSETSLFSLKNSIGQVTHWVQLQRDISDVVEQREKLRKANEKLDLMEKMSTHDMLNHLQAIEIYTEMASNITAESQIKPTLDKISGIAKQMRLQLSASKETQQSDNPVWMNLRKTFEQSISGMDLHGIILDIECTDAEILADRLLNRVFYNLVDNSIRHGGKVHRIGLRVDEVGNAALVTYTDDGVGIPASVKKVLFSEKHERPNHGLRLARDILGMTGITISESGEEGKGARFEMLVPMDSYRADGAWTATIKTE